jgi:signal transduction histidine kinase
MAYLHVVYDNGHEQEFVLSKGLVRIGRHSANDLQLTDDAASRFHAEIARRQGRFVVRDLESKNGVLVNNMQIAEHALTEGDVVHVGNVALTFHYDQSDSMPDSIEDVELIDPTEEMGGPIVQAKREVSESPIFEENWLRAASTSQVAVQNRLKSIAHLCRQLLTTSSPNDLLEESMDQISRQMPYDRGCIMLMDTRENRLMPQVVRDNRKVARDTAKIAVSMTIAEACLRDRSGVLCTDAKRDKRFAASDSIHALDLHSVLCVPLLGSEGPLGIIHLEAQAQNYAFTEMDLDYMIGVASELGIGLEHMRLREERSMHERLALIGRTVAGLSHHIKNILVVSEGTDRILGEAMEQGDLDRLREHWPVARRNREKIARLVKDMLGFSRADAGEPVRADIHSVLSEIEEDIRPRAEKQSVDFSFQLDGENIEGYFHPESLHRAVLNLALNALDALNETEQPAIVIAAETAEDNSVRIMVQDNGPGIPPESIDRVFEPFYSTKEGRGTGLGLALTHKLILDMGGTLECESEPELGTAFVITLPVATLPPGAETDPELQAASQNSTEDDDPFG